MKIYQSEDDGVIGEFLYQTVEFTQKEFADKGIGVISQVAVRQYLIEERPDLKIKKLGSFKFDSQKNTVTVRIATVNKIVPVALLNPGYDELKDNYDRTKKRYDALVIAVSKDAQKFSDLLVENENLKAENDRLMLRLAEWSASCVSCGRVNKNVHVIIEEDAADILNIEYDGKIMGGANPNQILHVTGQLDPEDAADLADAKKAIKSADSVLLPEFCDEDDEVGPDLESEVDGTVE